jgi:hypothetical protein
MQKQIFDPTGEFLKLYVATVPNRIVEDVGRVNVRGPISRILGLPGFAIHRPA